MISIVLKNHINSKGQSLTQTQETILNTWEVIPKAISRFV